MATSTNLKVKVAQESPGKVRKKKMALPRRILRILESGKRLHFQNVSLSKKRQMCLNHYLPLSDIAAPSGSADLPRSPVLFSPELTLGILDESEMKMHAKVPLSEQCSIPDDASNSKISNMHKPQSAKDNKATVTKVRSNRCKEVVAIDCEMVGLGPKGRYNALGRCSIVDHSGKIIYDGFVKPEDPITDYRTKWSGIRPRNMINAIAFREAQEQVVNILKEKIVVGHAVFHDFQVLRYSHPPNDVRDTSKCKLLAELYGRKCKPGQHLGLKSLAKSLLGMDVQKGEHSSVEDARAAMDLYKLVEEKWEEEIQSTFPDREFRTSFLDDHFWPEGII